MYNDPMEKAPAIEPTQYARPYTQYPTYLSMPEIPPPPPRQERKISWGIVVIAIVLILTTGLIFTGWQYFSHQKVANTVTTIPTPIPTLAPAAPTTAPTIIIETPTNPPTQQTTRYTASDIVRDFIQAGIPIDGSADGSGLHYDASWSCCTYTPENGAYYWTDAVAGTNVDIAVFSSPQEASTDSNELIQQRFATAVIRNCLLSFDMNFPDAEYWRYWQVMQAYC